MKHLKLGAPAAERDINYGLENYFIESKSYNNFVQNNKTVLIGNRGAGKSAIFKMIKNKAEKEGKFVLELSPDQYSYEILSELMKSEESGSWQKISSYSAAWRYLIYILLMIEIYNNRESIKSSLNKDVREIGKFLNNKIGLPISNKLDVLINYLKKIEEIKLLIQNSGGAVRINKLNNLYKLSDLNNYLGKIDKICKCYNAVILVDELDKGWDASEDAKAFISGLFQAAMSINDKSGNIRVYVSLRRELYDNIPALYEDAQKYRDVMENIEWDESSLLELIAKRIAYFNNKYNDKTSNEIWNKIFKENLKYRKSKSFNYIVDRTLYRPREIIQFCTEIIESVDESNLPVVYDNIINVEYQYSQARTQDIAAEYKYQYTGLMSIFDCFRGQVYKFTNDELDEMCMKIVLKEIEVNQDAAWVHDQDHEYLIDALWRIGFLQAYTVGSVRGGRKSGSAYLGNYQIPNLNLRNIKRFQVHPMFRQYLGMKEPR